MTQIFAHRGASKMAPENTMPAFELAYKMQADGIETDIQLTKDQIPVLIHDEHVKRTTNGAGYIKDFTYQQLLQLDAGSWFSDAFLGTSIVSLDAFLQWIKDKPLSLNIELKNNKIDYEHIESIAYEMIDHYQLSDRTILSSFNPRSIKRMKGFSDKINVAFLTSRKSKTLVSTAMELGATGIHVKYRLLNHGLVEQCKDANMSLRVFTVNKTNCMSKCFDNQCDGIFTDIPDHALAFRQQQNNEGAYQ